MLEPLGRTEVDELKKHGLYLQRTNVLPGAVLMGLIFLGQCIYAGLSLLADTLDPRK